MEFLETQYISVSWCRSEQQGMRDQMARHRGRLLVAHHRFIY